MQRSATKRVSCNVKRDKILLITWYSFFHIKTNQNQVSDYAQTRSLDGFPQQSLLFPYHFSSKLGEILKEFLLGIFLLFYASSKLLKLLCGCWKDSMEVYAEHWISEWITHSTHSPTNECRIWMRMRMHSALPAWSEAYQGLRCRTMAATNGNNCIESRWTEKKWERERSSGKGGVEAG